MEAYRKKRVLARAGILLVAFTLAAALMLSYFNMRLRPVLAEVSRAQALVLAERAANAAVRGCMESSGEALLQSEYDAQGRLIRLNCDAARANLLRTELSEALLAALETQEYSSFSVPIGSLIDGELLSDRGPGIEVRIVPVSGATVDLETDFTSGGINQTLFTLNAVLRVEVSLLLPFSSERTSLSVTVPLVQSIVVGSVPQVYVGG